MKHYNKLLQHVENIFAKAIGTAEYTHDGRTGIIEFYGIKHTDKETYRREVIKLWTRFVSACHLEKKWIKERQTLYMIINGVLLTALSYLSQTVNKGGPTPFELSPKLLAISLCIVAICISISTLIGVCAACRMYNIWYSNISRIIDGVDETIIKKSTFTFGSSANRAQSQMALCSQFLMTLIPTGFWSLLFVVCISA